MVVKKKCKKCGLYTVSSIAEQNPICPKCLSEDLENEYTREQQRTENPN